MWCSMTGVPNRESWRLSRPLRSKPPYTAQEADADALPSLDAFALASTSPRRYGAKSAVTPTAPYRPTEASAPRAPLTVPAAETLAFTGVLCTADVLTGAQPLP